jgi:hypothetical protein
MTGEYGSGVDTLVVDYSSETNACRRSRLRALKQRGRFNATMPRVTTRAGSISSMWIILLSPPAAATTASGQAAATTSSISARADDLVDLGSGSDSADGGEGVDGVSANLSTFGAGVTVDLTAASTAGAAGTLANFEYIGTLTTTAFDDVVVTRDIARDEFINTGAGADSVTVRNGYDRVSTERVSTRWSSTTAPRSMQSRRSVLPPPKLRKADSTEITPPAMARAASISSTPTSS